MAITATAGIFGFGLQADGAKLGAITTWHRHKSAAIDLAVLDDVRVGPPEIGGIPTPTFPYKGGVLVGGGASIFPRLESTIGWLLLGALGDCTTVANKDIDNVDVTGLYWHTFEFDAAAQEFVPYMGFRKLIPHPTAANRLGETYTDCKIVGLTMNFPNDGPLSFRVDAEGRDFVLDDNPTWTWSATYEDYQSIPVSCVTGGSLVFTPEGGSPITLPVVGATITLVNQPLDIRQERVYGDPKLEDVTIIGRSVNVDLVVKYSDPALYLQILTGLTNGTIWSASPFVGELVIESLSSRDIGSAPLNLPWRFRLTADSVLLQQQGGITLGANQTVLMRLTGQAIAPASNPYVTIEIQNETPSYTIPAADTTPPTDSAREIGTINDNTVSITFSEAVQLESGSDWSAGFTVNVNAAPATIVAASQYDSTHVRLVLSVPVTSGQTVTLDYTSTTGNIEDLSGNDLATFSAHAVTNNT